MKTSNLVLLPLLIAALYLSTADSFGVETEAVEKDGIKALKMGTGHDSISPGQTLEIGLSIEHLPEFHTYWKAPGIVGLPTAIEWTLPKGFVASELEWPVPEVTKMADYTCYGYERDVCLITKIQAPEKLEGDSVTLKAKVSFMCCAKTCHPGYQDFSLTIPINRTDAPKPVTDWQNLFTEARKIQPVAAPEHWAVKAIASDKQVIIHLETDKGKFTATDKAQCFCEANLVHSDRPQHYSQNEDRSKSTFTLVRSEFVKDPKLFTALLFNPEGWPGIESKWIRVNTPLTAAKAKGN